MLPCLDGGLEGCRSVTYVPRPICSHVPGLHRSGRGRRVAWQSDAFTNAPGARGLNADIRASLGGRGSVQEMLAGRGIETVRIL